MKLLHALRRPRWLVVIGCAAVLAPAAVLVSGVAATDDVVTSQATPLVDRDYIYGQLFDMAYNDVYRVSGADGPPTDPSSPWNEPATVNGWQEFFQHWKQQLTDKTVMTNMAKFATVQDHYFHRLPEQRTNPNYSFNPNYPWDSDDAEVTVPGATCPGQRVLLAAHPDGTPVSPTIVGEVNNPTGSTSGVNGFGAGRRTLTLSNIANGGAYDDTSGVTMTMGEYQALLRWYSINGTYPSKTLKIALLDASAGRAADGTYLREGAKYYANNLIPQGPQGQYAMFAEMNANGMSLPRVPPRDAVLLEQPRRTAVSARGAPSSRTRPRRRTRSTRTRAGRSRPTAPRSRSSRRTCRTRSRPASPSRARSTAARCRRRTRCATTPRARLREH